MSRTLSDRALGLWIRESFQSPGPIFDTRLTLDRVNERRGPAGCQRGIIRVDPGFP